jgi:isoquinoline 1-oxidoreductase beta subunit
MTTHLAPAVNLSRRRFLKSSVLAGGGLVLGCYWSPVASGANQEGVEKGTFAPNAFVRIGPDGVTTVMVNHSEMGQGTFTSLALLVAEELDADWAKVRAEHAGVDPA